MTFRVASGATRLAALALVNERYARSGYGGGHDLPLHAHTVVAESGGQIVATVSLVIEGDTARLVRLASTARSRDVLMGLFEAAARCGLRTGGAAWLEIEVSPRHAPFYRTAFGFEPVGALYLNDQVGVAAQRMRIAASDAVRRVADVRQAS